MTRIAGRVPPPCDIGTAIELILGPSEHTVEELELAWRAWGQAMLRSTRRVGSRPWAWWRFEAGEGEPSEADEPVRLAELGELRDDELAASAERASEARAGPGGDRRTIKLWERITAALP